MEHWWNDTVRGKLKYWETNCTTATLPTTNSAHTGLALNLGLHSDRQAVENCWVVVRPSHQFLFLDGGERSASCLSQLLLVRMYDAGGYYNSPHCFRMQLCGLMTNNYII